MNLITSLLPDGALHCVGSFLPPIEKALLCIATSATTLFQNDLQNAIELDFQDIDKELAFRLTDDDLHDILILTDAANRLTKLILTNCTGIAGWGLEPLRGSTVLEYLDLSFVSNQRPTLCVGTVAPIVDSIIERLENVGLLTIKFPKHWEESKNDTFVSLKERYGQFFIRGLTHC
jgi:hypothetical protein